MFRKQTVRTYERKKGIAHWNSASGTSTITREDIPPDIKLQPPEFKAFKDSDETLKYDPFDTTFDRLAKDTISHPIPQDQVSNSSYSESSSDSIHNHVVSSDDDSLVAAPFASPPTVVREKIKITRKRSNNKRPRLDEENIIVTTKTLTRDSKRRAKNTIKDENTEPNVEPKEIENIGGKKKSARKKDLQEKRPVVEETTKIFSRKGEKRKNVENSRAIKRCSVSLKRLSITLDKSLASTKREDDYGESEKKYSDASIIAESSEIDKSSVARLNDDASKDSTDFGAPSMMIETPKIDDKKAMEILKNPVVSLPRLSVSKRFSVRDFSSSTPIVARVAQVKSSLRLSPIKNNVNMEDTDDKNYSNPTSKSPKLIVRNSISDEQKMKEPMKRLTKILSITPDPEPSGLLFDDTLMTNEKSISPNLEITTDITDVSMKNQLMGFGRESSDQESVHLTYDDTNQSEELPSKNLLENLETIKFPPRSNSPISNENDNENMTTSTNDPFMGFSDVQTDIFKEKSNVYKTRNTDDEWSTISGSLNVTSDKSLTETRENVEQLSSSENTSSDGIAELVSASDISNSRVIPAENDTFDDTNESFNVESSVCMTKIVDKSKEKQPDDDDDNNDDNNRAFQPVVVLSRLTIDTIERIENTKDTTKGNFSDTLKSISQLSLDNDKALNSRPEESTSENEISLKRRDFEIFSDTEESQIEMDSLRVDDNSENMTEIEKSSIPKIPEKDLSKYTEESSIEYSTNASDISSRSMDRDKTDKLPKDADSSKSLELSDNEARAEKTELMEICENNNLSHEKNDSSSSIQPIVLLTRLNDPVRITRRRNKYRDWDLKLSAISENNVEKNSTAVDEDTEISEVAITPELKDIAEEISMETKIKPSHENSHVSSQNIFSQRSNDSRGTSSTTNQPNESIRDDKVVYLKPGKSWARSLSILSQVHSQEDLDFLAVGKGRKWRDSVQSLLEMQQQGLVQSCVKKNEDDKEPTLFAGLRNSTAWIPGSSQPDTSRMFGVSSPGRFIRRVSIRVVPDCKSFDHIKDTSFLEAYGITQSENRETITKRRTQIAEREVIPKVFENAAKSRDVVLAQCKQQSSLPFDECYPESYLENCRKIGEGVYGEVFLYEKDSVKSVIKIIPIEGDMMINSERQKKFDEILSEIVIAKELHNLRFAEKSNTSSFIEVKNVRCVIGKYPKKLIELWKNFDYEKNSENDCPSIFENDQLYIVLELSHGGEDLEAYVFQNAAEAHALFMQAALALAVAEESLEFEHRDLHWGNLLISKTDESHIDFKLNDKPISVQSKGVKVSVIDFTLSRMAYQGCSIFNDLSMDDDLFVAQGEYQFDIYRLMKKKLENNWQKFEPFTNILWLHYTLDKMITAVRYRRKNTKIHKNGIAKLQELKDEILEYKSSIDFVTNCDKATRLLGSRSSVSTVASSIQSL